MKFSKNRNSSCNFILSSRGQTVELDFLNAAQVVHHCATIDPVSTTWSSEGSRQRIWKSEGKVARVARESAMSVCRRHTSSGTSSAGLLYTLEYEGDEQTAVNTVLLKNRTLVNVFERVRNRGGEVWVSKGRRLTFFSPSPLPPPLFFSLRFLYRPPLDLTRGTCV